MSSQNNKPETVSITTEEFNTLQQQILQLKEENYEFLEREKRKKIGINQQNKIHSRFQIILFFRGVFLF
jgi:hypothetical protein